MSGLILVVLIGLLVAYAYTRLRGRMKLPVSGKNGLAPVVIIGVALLLVWATHNSH